MKLFEPALRLNKLKLKITYNLYYYNDFSIHLFDLSHSTKTLEPRIYKTTMEKPKTLLQEISQQLYKKLPEYKLIKKEGPPHSPTFTVSVKVVNLNKINSKGYSIRDAERNAAEIALKKINEKKNIKN